MSSADSLRRGGGVGVQAGLGEMFLQFGQAAILGAKVVTPMADAMGLVDGEGVNLDFFGELHEVAV